MGDFGSLKDVLCERRDVKVLQGELYTNRKARRAKRSTKRKTSPPPVRRKVRGAGRVADKQQVSPSTKTQKCRHPTSPVFALKDLGRQRQAISTFTPQRCSSSKPSVAAQGIFDGWDARYKTMSCTVHEAKQHNMGKMRGYKKENGV